MRLLANQAPHLTLLVVGVAALLLCAAAIAAARTWLPASPDLDDVVIAAGQGSPALAAEGFPEGLRVSLRCAECGVVASTREIAQLDATAAVQSDRRSETGRKSSKRYEVTVRMRDGTIRTFVDTTPGNWRAGERITLIEGSSGSSR